MNTPSDASHCHNQATTIGSNTDVSLKAVNAKTYALQMSPSPVMSPSSTNPTKEIHLPSSRHPSKPQNANAVPPAKTPKARAHMSGTLMTAHMTWTLTSFPHPNGTQKLKAKNTPWKSSRRLPHTQRPTSKTCSTASPNAPSRPLINSAQS